MLEIFFYLVFSSYIYASQELGCPISLDEAPSSSIEKILFFFVEQCSDNFVLKMAESAQMSIYFRHNNEFLFSLFLISARKGNCEAYWHLSRLFLPGRRNSGLFPRYKAKYYFLISKYLRQHMKTEESTELKSDIIGIKE